MAEMPHLCPACLLKDLVYLSQAFFDKMGRHSHWLLNTGVLGGLWTITSLSSREGNGLDYPQTFLGRPMRKEPNRFSSGYFYANLYKLELFGKDKPEGHFIT